MVRYSDWVQPDDQILPLEITNPQSVRWNPSRAAPTESDWGTLIDSPHGSLPGVDYPPPISEPRNLAEGRSSRTVTATDATVSSELRLARVSSTATLFPIVEPEEIPPGAKVEFEYNSQYHGPHYWTLSLAVAAEHAGPVSYSHTGYAVIIPPDLPPGVKGFPSFTGPWAELNPSRADIRAWGPEVGVLSTTGPPLAAPFYYTGINAVIFAAVTSRHRGEFPPLGTVGSDSTSASVIVTAVYRAYTPPRYRFVWPSGMWNLRQRQSLTGNAGGWPLRQRQTGGATGSWPLRQRQTGT